MVSGPSANVALFSVQDKEAKKRPPLIPPKRLVAIASIDIKLTTGPAPNKVSFGAGLNNASASATAADGYIDIPNPSDFGEGLTDVMITSLTESKGFSVVDLPAGAAPGTGSPDEAVPELLVKAVIVEMSCRKRSGGLSIGDISGGHGQYENKVTMDVRLVDPVTNVVVDSVKATGRKTSKSSIFGAKTYLGSIWDPNTKILDLSYGDFEDSPLAEATRLATQDAAKKLIEKAQKRPWEAKVIKVVQEDSGPEFYLNVGGDCGLKVGDKLNLLQLGEPIVDDKSGKVIGRTRSKLVASVEVLTLDEASVVCKVPSGAEPPILDEAASYVVRVIGRT